MKITSWNRAAGRKAKAKEHQVDECIHVGYQRDGLTGKRIPGAVLSLYFDNRRFIVELSQDELEGLYDSLKTHAFEG